MWVRVDDGFPQHHKVLAAAHRLGGTSGIDRVLSAWIQLMCYSNRHLTDGFISDAVAMTFHGIRPVESLKVMASKQVRLLDRVKGGWRVHDYHDYQPSSADIKEKQAWDRQRKALYTTPGLVDEIRSRDRNRCRYCGRIVNWKDRRSSAGGTLDHVIPRGPNTIENVVVACFGCNNKKSNRTPEQARMPLLPANTAAEDEIGTSSSLADIKSSAIGPGNCDPDPIRSDPIRPDRKDQEQRAVARESHRVLLKLAHEVLDRPDSTKQPASELCNRIKDLAGRRSIPYDGREVTKALESAEAQRRRSA